MQRRRMTYRPNGVQGKNWILVIWGVILLTVGFGTMMSTSAALGAVWTLVAVFLIVNGARKALAPKNASKLDDSPVDFSYEPDDTPQEETDAPQVHDHIPSQAPSVQERLEQLRSLKEAGLMDNAEYEQRKKKLFKGQ